MKVHKKTVETVSIKLTEADIYRALAEYIKNHDGSVVSPSEITIRRGDDGEYEASVELTRETGDTKPKAKKVKAPVHINPLELIRA